MIELWLVDLEACADALEALERDTPRLADDDRDRAGTVSGTQERRHRLAAYTALRVLLERAAGPGVRGKPQSRAPGGKPALGDSGVDYSLSHTEGLALIGVSRGAGCIGVDLERARPIKMSERAQGEICAIGAGLGDRPLPGPGTDRAFLQAWARLEAFAKARGRGVARTLADLGQRGRGRLRQLPPRQLETAARRLARDTGLAVRDLALPPGLHGTLAAVHTRLPVRPRTFPPDRASIEALLNHHHKQDRQL